MPESEISGEPRRSRTSGIVLLLLGSLILLSIVCRIVFYHFDYDPVYWPYDYGRWNYFSYFTVLSNLLAACYLLLYGAAAYGGKTAKKLTDPPLVGLSVTTYMIVTGLVYNGGIPLGFTPPLTWDTSFRIMLSCVQILHHMIVPVAMIVLWVLRRSDSRLSYRLVLPVMLFPAVYSVCSIVRGDHMQPRYYPYPFYDASYIHQVVFGDKVCSVVWDYVITAAVLAVGIWLFAAVAALLIRIRNHRVKQTAVLSEVKLQQTPATV